MLGLDRCRAERLKGHENDGQRRSVGEHYFLDLYVGAYPGSDATRRLKRRRRARRASTSPIVDDRRATACEERPSQKNTEDVTEGFITGIVLLQGMMLLERTMIKK